jgi:hypothetical protein
MKKLDNIKFKKSIFEAMNESELKVVGLECIKVIGRYAFNGYPYEWAYNSLEAIGEITKHKITVASFMIDLEDLKEQPIQ